MSAIIKICGLSSQKTVAASMRAGASHVGFVFHPKSPRNISIQKAAQLANFARGLAKTVALVANPSKSLIQDIIVQVRPDVIQFHGKESVAEIKATRESQLNGIEVWKALGIAQQNDLHSAKDYDPFIDKLLFDAQPPQGATRLGGHGVAFDWNLLTQYSGQAPWILAGGLTPTTIEAAIVTAKKISGFAGVDVSSGVESSPGKKDIEAIESFIRKANSAMHLA